MKLYEIAEIFQIALQNSVDQETGEISEQALIRLDEIGTDLREKAKNVGAYIGNLEAEADAIRKAEKRMAKRRKSLERQAKQMREYLLVNMERCGISEISTPYFVLKLRKCPPSKDELEVQDAKLVTDRLRLEIK